MWGKQFVGLNLTGFENNGTEKPISRVTLFIDDDNYLTAGDDTGYELSGSCPHATQEMVDNILASVKGYAYKMLTADSATLDPAAELGDGLTASGVYTVLSRISDDGMFPDVDAVGEAEAQDEFPTDGPLTQTFNRKVSETRAQIIKTSDEIRLEVSEEFENVRGELSLKVGRDENDQIVSMINASANTIELYGNRIIIDSTNFKVTENGTVTAKKGEFEEVTINGSTFTGTNTNSGTVSGGTYSSPSISRGTLSSSTGGTYVGTCSGSALSACTTNGTDLTVRGGSLTASNGYSDLSGTSGSLLSAGSYYIRVSTGQTGGYCLGTFYSTGNLSCGGTKSRSMETDHFGTRQLDAFETPLPSFSDYGKAKLDETGVCYITIDPVFLETVNAEYEPTVFLTKYADGDLWVENVTHDMIVIRGTPNIWFSWETRYVQNNAYVDRLRVMDFDRPYENNETNFDLVANTDMEHNTIDYADIAYEYITEFERSIEAA